MVTSSGDRIPEARFPGIRPYAHGGTLWAVHLPAATYEDAALRAEWQQAGFATMGPPRAALGLHPVSELCTECSNLPGGPAEGDQVSHMQGRARTVALRQAGRRA